MNPRHSASYLVTHFWLLWRVTRSELRSRYAGSLLGLGWAVLAPLLIVTLYAVVYLVIFRVQVPGLSPAGYVLYVFSGLVPFLMTSEALSAGVSSVVTNKAVLSNTVFPIDLAPVKAVLLSQVTMIVGMAVIFLGAAMTGVLQWTAIFAPAVWILHTLALMGLTWGLSILNVILRDLQNLIGPLLMLLVIVSPIAYTPDMVPSSLKPLILLNPFAYYVIAYQQLLTLGQVPDGFICAMLVLLSLGFFVLGGWLFPRAKRVVIDYV